MWCREMWISKEQLLRELEQIIPEDGCEMGTDIESRNTKVMNSMSPFPVEIIRNEILTIKLSMDLDSSGLKVVK